MSYVVEDNTPTWTSWRTTVRASTDIAETLAAEHEGLMTLATQIRALVPETDHASVDQRRRLVRKLRIRMIAHARATQELFPGKQKIARDHTDLAARIDQLQVIPLDHPLWIMHFDQLESRLIAHADCELDVIAELRRRLDEASFGELDQRYRRSQDETLALLERRHPGRREIRRRSAARIAS